MIFRWYFHRHLLSLVINQFLSLKSVGGDVGGGDVGGGDVGGGGDGGVSTFFYELN